VPLPPLVQPGALLPSFAPKVWTISLIPAVTALGRIEQCDGMHACLANSSRMLSVIKTYNIYCRII
jgi:hypothetical protein